MNHYAIAMMILGMAGIDTITQPTSALERGGIVAILLAAVVVLWRQGQMEGRATRELLEKVLAAISQLERLEKGMERLSERLTNLHCPLLDSEEEAANGIRDKRGPGRR